MRVLVVDASALAALTFGEPEAEAVVERLEGARLAAPTLLGYELANVAVTKIRRYPELREEILAALEAAARLEIDLFDVPPQELPPLAEASGLTAYDAAYLWLARRLGAGLVTLDAALHRAAR